MKTSGWDEWADVFKVAEMAVLAWVGAVMFTVIGYFGWCLWCATWDFIARLEWMALP